MRAAALAALLVLLFAPALARAEEAAPDDWIDPSMRRSWNEGAPRGFAAAQVDVGYLYFRPRAIVGYGVPFHEWLGLEVSPIVINTSFGAYAGARFAVPFVDLRAGLRQVWAFQHGFITPKPSVERLEIEASDRGKASYLSLELELNLTVPAGPGEFFANVNLSSVESVPAEYWVFEETLRVVVDPPWVSRLRYGYVFRFGAHDQYSIGPAVDVLVVPERDDALTVRVGPLMSLALSRHWDVRGSFVTTVWSPDKLGLPGSDFTELGLRYRFATQ